MNAPKIFLLVFCLFACVQAQAQNPIIPWQVSVSSNVTIDLDTLSRGAGGGLDTAKTPIIIRPDCSSTTTLSIVVDSLGAGTKGTIHWGIETANNTYHFIFGRNTTKSFQNGSLLSTLLGGTTEGDELTLVFDGSTSKLISKRNGVNLLTISGVENSYARSFIRFPQAYREVYNTEFEQNCHPSTIYAELQDELDGHFAQLVDDTLRFKFMQEYHTTTTNTNISYNIYDWQRNATSGTFATSYGINWEEINVSSLTADTYYILEITANKGKNYYLRFKTDD